MKKVFLLVLCLSFIIAAVHAMPMQPDFAKRPLESLEQGRPASSGRYLPDYSFTKTPTVLLESYYDYMIGSYNSIPIRSIPLAEGGYFITFHGKRTPAGERRVFYAHLTAAGQIYNINEISQVTNAEGYPSLAVDPVSGKPLYAWHAASTPELITQFTSDAYIWGVSSLLNEIETVMDNPLDIFIDGVLASADNAFVWPTIQIGPSPIDGKRRAYIGGRNKITHTITGNPSENLLIAYADFDGDMIEEGADLVWSYTSIPELDQWNHGQGDFRRPNCSLATDNLGNVYYAGSHVAKAADDNDLDEPAMDVFICPNYGAGTWTRISVSDRIPAWDPLFPDGTHAFNAEGELFWGIINSAHMNTVVMGEGRIIFPVVYGLQSTDNTYYPAYQTVKASIYDTRTQQFYLRDIYPKKNRADTFNPIFMPWDTEYPWGVAEYVQDESGTYYADSETIYPFPHWDRELHDGSMEFHCGYVKVSEPNAQGLMVAVWQDSYRAQLYNKYPESYPELAAFANTPEVYIATSGDCGGKWSEPIVLNKVETPAFANLKPMWVYPADKVITTGTGDYNTMFGKIGFLMYDDYTWGANAVAPPAHSVNDGGAVMFMEMEIEFDKTYDTNTDVTAPQITRMLNQNYPNPFNPETNISFDMPANGNAKLQIYNVKGQLVKSLFDGTATFGRTSLVWNGIDNGGNAVTSGIYFYRLTTDQHRETRKMMLMK